MADDPPVSKEDTTAKSAVKQSEESMESRLAAENERLQKRVEELEVENQRLRKRIDSFERSPDPECEEQVREQKQRISELETKLRKRESFSEKLREEFRDVVAPDDQSM